MYATDVVVDSVAPTSGSLSGGTVLTVMGSGFVFSSNLKCRLGLVSVPATYVSPTQLSCTTPATAAGPTGLTVTNNGHDFSATSVLYTFKSVATVELLSPSGGYIAGGTKVAVKGTGFTNTAQLACRFGSMAALVKFVSPTVVECTSPAAAAGVTSVAGR